MPFDGLSHVAQVLLVGRSKIEAGWCQGSAHDYRGAHCAGAAINWDEAACALLMKTSGCDSQSITLTSWNDSPIRTKDDVLAAYDAAITLALA